MKTIKLNQKQLRSLISEAITTRQPGSPLWEAPMEPGTANPDEEMGRKLAETFTMMLSPEPEMLHQLTEELASYLLHHDDEAFFPARYEDIDRASYAAARIAAQRIVQSSDFISFLGDALARAYRKVGLEK